MIRKVLARGALVTAFVIGLLSCGGGGDGGEKREEGCKAHGRAGWEDA